MVERRAIRIRGIVQGVGFRPFVYNLAVQLGLGGAVKNQTGTVHIEVEGETAVLEQFLTELADRPPPLAQIEDLFWEQRPPLGERRFRIDASEADPGAAVFISPDVAVCRDCLAELFDPADRRFGYPFLNCTNCGPRLTIIRGAPYDRSRTTMAGFPMCDACRAEYEDPTNRRFHAQPTACAACGPALELRDAEGRPIGVADPLAVFAAALIAGKIGALKGLGGYHLASDAGNAAVVAELRRRKHRDEKPFAVMVPDAASAEILAEVGREEDALLRSPQCPIVLLRKRHPPSPPAGEGQGWGVADEVAPRNPFLGVMLPYTPLHHLLLRAVGGRPLVMTSGNRSDEPIACRDDEALAKLAGIADLFLMHNRPIHVRCDDSVTRVVDGVELPLRRSRGYAPRPIEMPIACSRPILAVGGQLKGTFALGRDRQAFLSHHLGDLDHYDAYLAFEKDVALYQQLFAVEPQVVAHDLHPDYATTRYAQRRAAESGVALLAVQHHHAHLAACMAEHGLTAPVIGVAFDGTGYGTDGAVWGGEFLVGDCRNFRRAAHLRYVGLPGGDQAVREPWRMAVAHLADAGADFGPLRARILLPELRVVDKMLERRFNTPPTSSVGRLFDAAASLAGVRDRVSYEGQAAVELEWLAETTPADGSYPFDLEAQSEAPLVVDVRPLIRAVVKDVQKGVGAAVIARRFHSTVADLIAGVCGRIRAETQLNTVVLSGGVFLNALLTREATARLQSDGFRVYRHRKVPPGDGGLSLGQLAVAAASSIGAAASATEERLCPK
ncbi:MAG TPA: carbamoyltransferase HypF [Gemmataceae bacterium]|nr:carbamoyltransferase HypF [Gemmataceae bacterium]